MPIAALPKLQPSDFTYLGAFKVPVTSAGDPSLHGGLCNLTYGGNAIWVDPSDQTIYAVCSTFNSTAVCQISIPATLSTSPNLVDLARAVFIQPPRRCDKLMMGDTGATNDIPPWDISTVDGHPNTPSYEIAPMYHDHGIADNSFTRCLGILGYGDRLIMSGVIDYDGFTAARRSHYALSSKNLSTAVCTPWSLVRLPANFAFQPMQPVHHAGNTGGYMAAVPPEWQAELPSPAITGCSDQSVTNRNGVEPVAIGFDPDAVGDPDVDVVGKLFHYGCFASEGARSAWPGTGLDPLPGIPFEPFDQGAYWNGTTLRWGPGPPPRTSVFMNGYRYYYPGLMQSSFVPINGTRTLVVTRGGTKRDRAVFYGAPHIPGIYDPNSGPWANYNPTMPDWPITYNGYYGASYDIDAATVETAFTGQTGNYTRELALYDAQDLVDIYAGTLVTDNDELHSKGKPYALFPFLPPIDNPDYRREQNAGASYDPTTQRLYVVGYDGEQGVANYPLIHVYSVNVAGGGGNGGGGGGVTVGLIPLVAGKQLLMF